jgi:hypothetical protein
MREYLVFENLCSASAFPPKLNNVEVAELLAAVLLVSLGSHLVFHAAPQHWHRAQRERREQALRRLDNLTRQISELKQPVGSELEQPVDETPAWQSSDYSRFFVPSGLRLEQARRVIREARDSNDQDFAG